MQRNNQFPSALVIDQAVLGNDTVDAGLTGSGSTAVLEFAALATSTAQGTISENTLAARAADGTVVSLGSAGIYHISFAMVAVDAAGNPVSAGISFGSTGVITADPVIGTNGVIWACDFVATGVASTDTMIGQAVVVRCTAAMVTASTDQVRFLATDGAAGAPASIQLASVQYRITKIAHLSV